VKERAKRGVLERPCGTGKVCAVRFQVHGERHYLTLGSPEEGWTRRRAEEELQDLRTDFRRGKWVPPRRRRGAFQTATGGCLEEFERFARVQIAERGSDVTTATSRYREWALSHLLPYFTGWRLAEIDARSIDSYRAHKVTEAEARRRGLEQGRPLRDRRGQTLRPLSTASINKTIEVLQWLLSLAVEYGQLQPRQDHVGSFDRPVGVMVGAGVVGRLAFIEQLVDLAEQPPVFFLEARARALARNQMPLQAPAAFLVLDDDKCCRQRAGSIP